VHWLVGGVQVPLAWQVMLGAGHEVYLGGGSGGGRVGGGGTLSWWCHHATVRLVITQSFTQSLSQCMQLRNLGWDAAMVGAGHAVYLCDLGGGGMQGGGEAGSVGVGGEESMQCECCYHISFGPSDGLQAGLEIGAVRQQVR
jgi:hypothetical protein